MTLTQLECFTALSREGDSTLAAKFCGLSAEAFANALKGLENEFGIPLLLPGSPVGGFTPAGHLVLHWAARSLRECDMLRHDVRNLQADRAVAPLVERRSVSPKRLGGSGPGRDDIDRMLKAALRAPDHGGLHPWRVIEFASAQRDALAELFEQEKLRRDPLAPADDLRRAREHATRPPLLLAFVVTPLIRSHVPVREQWLSAGAALGNLLNAAHGLGYGAIILSGERYFDAELTTKLGVAQDEFLAGFVSLGTIVQAAPTAPVIPTHSVWSAWEPACVKLSDQGTGTRLSGSVDSEGYLPNNADR